jgi:hypothetical protein
MLRALVVNVLHGIDVRLGVDRASFTLPSQDFGDRRMMGVETRHTK